MGLGEEGAKTHSFFSLVSFSVGNWKHTLTHIKNVKTSGQVVRCSDIGPLSFVIYYPFTKAHSAGLCPDQWVH